MPSIILSPSSTANSLSPTQASGTPSATLGGGFLFYSNNPETVPSTARADSGKYLSRQTVTGSGQIYTWHENGTGGTVTSTILVYNPNSYPITVSSSNNGITNSKGVSDTSAWVNYLKGTSPVSISIAPGKYDNLFVQSIPNGNNFGVVARLNVVNSSTLASASAVLWDLVYTSDSSGGTAQAELSGGKQNGYGSVGSYNYLNFPTIAPTTTNGLTFSIGYNGDNFGSLDIVPVTGASSGRIEGSYGSQFYITMPIQNTDSVSRTFRVFLGDTGGFLFPVVNGYGGVVAYKDWVSAGTYVDVVDVTIPGSTTQTINFTVMFGAIGAAPIKIGARRL